jgi:hypothetical protein
MSKGTAVLRFLRLNIYSFLLVSAGILTLAAPFYKISPWTLVPQALASIKLFMIAGKLFSTWPDKKLKMEILTKKNREEFRPDTFAVFMQAPCGRLLARQVLADLHRGGEYQSLLKLRKPLLERLRNNCAPVRTVVYIREEGIHREVGEGIYHEAGEGIYRKVE